MNFTDIHKQNAYFHSLLALEGSIKVGTAKQNELFKEKLLAYGGSLEKLYSHPETLFKKEIDQKQLDSLSKIINNASFSIITIADEQYPSLLKDIRGAPPLLYASGDLSLLNPKKSIGIIGTRNPCEYTKNQGPKVTKIMVERDYVIVSGLALGCDTIAHQTAVDNGGKTIAVLATPLNKHLKSNENLQNIIAKDHLLLSEFPFGIRVFPSYFAHRNLTTAGLSSAGVIALEAGEKSGTIHAIRHAYNQKKEVYALEINKGRSWAKTYDAKFVGKK